MPVPSESSLGDLYVEYNVVLPTELPQELRKSEPAFLLLHIASSNSRCQNSPKPSELGVMERTSYNTVYLDFSSDPSPNGCSRLHVRRRRHCRTFCTCVSFETTTHKPPGPPRAKLLEESERMCRYDEKNEVKLCGAVLTDIETQIIDGCDEVAMPIREISPRRSEIRNQESRKAANHSQRY